MCLNKTFTLVSLLFSSILFAQGVEFNASEDAYVRGGVNASTNYGTDDQLSLKNSGGEDYDRKLYLKFDLTSLSEPFQSATIQLTPKSSGPDFEGSTAELGITNNSWSEGSINWSNAPVISNSKTTVSCSENAVSWDITSFVSEALQGDSILTLLLHVPNEGSSDSWVHYYSREASSGQPKLTINGDVVSTLIPENNQVDWSTAGVEGGIPSFNNIVDVSSVGLIGDNSTDNSNALQLAIDNAASGTVFYFPSGTFLFNTTIYMKDSVVLLGNCVANTTLKFDLAGEAKPSIWWKSDAVASSATAITAGYEKGSTQITVTDATGYKVGEYIEIMQDNDPALMYTQQDWDVSWSEESVGQVCPITAINGNVITIKYPLMYDFSTGLNVRAKWAEPIKYAGLENLHVFRVDNGNDYNLRFDNAANCWIRNIEGDYCDRGHFAANESANLEVRESYFHHAYDYGGGGHGYGINLQDHTTGCLFENNIFYYLRHTFLAKAGAIGNVFSYNYSLSPNGSANDIALHGYYGLMNLMEGNIVQKMIAGDWWGPSGPGNTYFRNRVESSDIIMQDATHSQNIVANEILNGTVSIIESDNTWQLSNKNSSGFIDNEFAGSIDASLYHDSKPNFMDGNEWPAIGPEFSLNQNTIPAKARWDDNGLDLVPCLDVGLITSIQSIESEINIFPNPSNDVVNITGYDGIVEVYDVLGNRVIVSNNTQINVLALNSGVYFVNLIGVNQSLKLIVK